MAQARQPIRGEANRPASPRKTATRPSGHPRGRNRRRSDERHAAPQARKFQPNAAKRRTRRREIVELLRERGEGGVTRLDCPTYLVLSMPARICELRKAGYEIETIPERVDHATVARYVLHGEPDEKADP